jgi:polyribonucleotide nucleotidyltransferase
MRWGRTDKTEDVVKKGDRVKVKLIDRDERGRLRLSMRALQPKPEGQSSSEESSGGGAGDELVPEGAGAAGGGGEQRERRPRRGGGGRGGRSGPSRG